MSSPRRRNRRTTAHARAAYSRARDLGPVVPVPEDELQRGPSGVPLLSAGRVYVTPSGARFHPEWCQIVADAYDRRESSVVVTRLEDVGGRTECGVCTTEGGLMDAHA